MTTLLKKEFPLTLASQPRIRRAWLSCEKPLFLAQLSESGDGFVTAVQHNERYELPELGKVSAFAFRPINETQTFYELAAATKYGVQRFDLVAGIKLMDLEIYHATAVCYSSCGRFLAVGNNSGELKVFDLTGECPEQKYCGSAARSAIGALAFSSTGDLLYVVTLGGDMLVADLKAENAAPVAYLQQHGEELLDQDLYCLACHPSAPIVACAGHGHELHLVETTRFEMVTINTDVGVAVKHVEFLDSLQQFVVVGTSGAEIWGRSGGALRRQHSFKLAEGEKVLAVKKYGDTLFVVKQGT